MTYPLGGAAVTSKISACAMGKQRSVFRWVGLMWWLSEVRSPGLVRRVGLIGWLGLRLALT